MDHYVALVSTPEQRARDKDRDAAITMVEAAWADGQIVEADRDKRVEELGRAQTLGEIRMFTQGLEPTMSDAAPPTPPAPPASPVEYGPSAPTPVSTTTTAKMPKALLVVPLIVVLVVGVSVVGGIVALVNGASNGIDSVTSSQSYAPGEEPDEGDVNVLSEGGYADLVAAVKDETGATTSFSAVLYPTYAVVEIPVDATTQREKYYYWDGRTLVDQDSKNTSTGKRFDLQSVDPAVVVRLVQKVRRLSDEPTSWYAAVRAPDESDGSMIWAYASNDYRESVYIGARLDGTIVYNSAEQ